MSRRGLWLQALIGAVLVMVVAGLAIVWWTTGGGGATEPLPVLGEVPPFELVDRHGEPVSRSELAGGPWVADLIFTRCRLSCPRMTQRMADLGDRLPAPVRRVSVTVDPAHDTPEVLADYAAEHSASETDWLFLTGAEPEIRRLAVDGFKLGVSRRPESDPKSELEPLTHSTRFVLVDGDGRIRGYYDAFDDGSIAELVNDARRLAGEAAL